MRPARPGGEDRGELLVGVADAKVKDCGNRV